MVEVDIMISGILMCCDETLCGISLGRGYSIEKCELNTLFFNNKIINGEGKLDVAYYNSQIIENGEVFFICIKKHDLKVLDGPKFGEGRNAITSEECMCEDELAEYREKEMQYLQERINLLRIFKEGNIGFKTVFFSYSFETMGIFNVSLDDCSTYEGRNIIANNSFTLDAIEVEECNRWLNDYSGNSYALLKNSIEEFSWGLEQIDIPTGFEQYTTTLEMTLLPSNKHGKKQMLANRISAMLESTPLKIQQVHEKILVFYRFRSESLHEGDGSSITASELHELEELTRGVLKKCLIRCKYECDLNSNITWEAIKEKIMNELVERVKDLKVSGILPE